MDDAGEPRRPSMLAVALAFAAVYLIWGSTYLAMRIIVAEVPPFLAAGVRFLVAGSILFLIGRPRAAVAPDAAQWKAAFIVGAFLCLGGNGLLMWAEKTVPSGIAALLVATVPMWMALFGRIQRHAPASRRTWSGILLGFGGVVVLVADPGQFGQGGYLLGAVVVVICAGFWAFGSLYSRSAPSSDSPLLQSGMQLLCGGACLLVVGALSGEGRHVVLPIGRDTLLWVGYLVVFGSVVAYSCSIWILRVSVPAKVSTYAYVNPVVAVILGYLVLGEELTMRTAWGAAAIVLGIVLIVTPGFSKKTPPTETVPAADA